MSKNKQPKPSIAKCIVVTTRGNILLNSDGTFIKHNRPTLVAKTAFVESMRDDGVLKILAINLPSSATDDDFYIWYIESNRDPELAITSYCAKYNQLPDGSILDVKV